jgi:DNA-binding NtrC family response regulator
MDVEDLRRHMDDYRRSHPELHTTAPMYPTMPLVSAGRSIDAAMSSSGNGTYESDEDDDEESVVVFKPGVTIQAMEKDAIIAALRSVAGNRRKAAEMLGLGERTLYRKIKEYGIPV